MDVTNEVWLQAISDHPETIDTDLLVGVHLALTGSANGVSAPCPDCGEVELLDVEDVEDSIYCLTDLGFLEFIVSMPDVDGTEDHLFALRMPEAAA